MRAKLKSVLIHLPEILSGAGLIVSLLLTTINALSRYFFSTTYVGTDEIVAIAFSWTVFCGAAAAYRRGMHYGIDLISVKMKGVPKAVLGIVTQVAIMLVLGCFIYYSWVLTLNTGSKIMTATRISYAYFDMGMTVGFSFMGLFSVNFMVQRVRELRAAIRERKAA